MFDTMTVTKAGGALCGALLTLLLIKWAGDALFDTVPRAHGDEEITQAFVIDTGAEEAGGEEVAEGPDFATLLAAADPAAGEKAFGKCKACHKLDGTDGVGPHLNGVVGRAKGAVAGFAYSEAMLAVASESWAPENLDAFLVNPKKYLPGTKMSFAGLPKAEDRANIVAYLQTVN
jgi:cytochrome c